MLTTFIAITSDLAAMLNKCFAIRSQKGVNTIEYGLLGVLVSIALIGSIQGIQNILSMMFANIASSF